MKNAIYSMKGPTADPRMGGMQKPLPDVVTSTFPSSLYFTGKECADLASRLVTVYEPKEEVAAHHLQPVSESRGGQPAVDLPPQSYGPQAGEQEQTNEADAPTGEFGA